MGTEKSHRAVNAVNFTARLWIMLFAVMFIVQSAIREEEYPWGSRLLEHSAILLVLPVLFLILLAIALLECSIVCLNFPEPSAMGSHKYFKRFIRYLDLALNSGQIVIRDETILLGIQAALCYFGFFRELHWYLAGTAGLLVYLFLYICLCFMKYKRGQAS